VEYDEANPVDGVEYDLRAAAYQRLADKLAALDDRLHGWEFAICCRSRTLTRVAEQKWAKDAAGFYLCETCNPKATT